MSRKLANETWFAYNLRYRYGITVEDYMEMYERQEGRCNICRKELPLGAGSRGPHVDHDHDTKRVRGLLCPPCNRHLERFIHNLPRALAHFGVAV